jgi:hypothetical protein
VYGAAIGLTLLAAGAAALFWRWELAGRASDKV